MFPAFEAIYHIGQAGASFSEVRRINLCDVPHAHHLGAGTCAGDQRLHLFGREILRFVDDYIFVEESAPAHEVEGFNLDPRTNQIARGGTPPIAAFFIGLIQHVEIVFQRAHPGCHFFFLGAGQKSDVFAYRNGHAGDDDF